MIIAVDFDGCLVTNEWPRIGKPNLELFASLKMRQAAGDEIILWTCRTGKALEEAMQFCYEQGLVFDKVNDNLDRLQAKFQNSRKVYADEYWDDKAVKVQAGMTVAPSFGRRMERNYKR